LSEEKPVKTDVDFELLGEDGPELVIKLATTEN
jgi:hypothetical protein